MKYQKLVDELNDLLDSATMERQKHQETLRSYRGKIEAEEKNLCTKLECENDYINRRRLRRELGMVKLSYEYLGS